MAATIGAQIQVDGEKTFQSALSALNQQLTAFKAGAEAASSSLGKMGNDEDAAAKKAQALQGVIDTSQQKLDLLKTKYQEAQERLAKLAAEMEKARQAGNSEQIDKATNAYNNQVQAVAKLETEMARTETTMNRASQEMENLGQETDEAGEKSSKLGDILQNQLVNQALSTLENALNTVAEKVKQFAQACMEFIKEASQYETSMNKVKTIADETKVTHEELSESIMDLSNKTGIAATEIAEATYQAISGGVDTAEAVSTVATATQLAAGGFTETSAAIDVLTTVMNAYGIEASQSAEISDKLIATQNLGKTTVADLAANMGRVIPIAASYNVNLDNLAAAYAVLTANGINTANSTTYLASMFNELAKEGSTVSKTLQDETGKSFSELMASGASLDDVMQILMKSVEGDTTAFSNLWSSQTAGLGALTLVNSGTEKYNATLQAMQESTGAATDAYQTMSSTFEHQSQVLQNSFTNFKTSIYESIKEPIGQVMQVAQTAMDKIQEWAASAKGQETLKRLADAIATAAEKLSDNLEPAIELAISLIEQAGNVISFCVEHLDTLVAAFVALKGAIAVVKFSQFITSIKTVGTAFSSVGSIVASFGASAGAILAKVGTAIAALNPIVVAIVAAVAAAAVLIIKHWDEIKEWALKAWEGIKNAWNQAGQFFSNVGASIKNALSATVTWLGDVFKKAWEAVRTAWQVAGEFFTGVWNSIEKAFSNVTSWIGDVFTKAWESVRNAWASVGEFFSGVFNTIVDAFTNLPGKMLEVGKNAVSGIWEGIKNAKDWLWGKLTGWVDDCMGWIKGLFGIHSPSTLMRDEVGKMLGAGVAEGILGSVGMVQNAYKAMLPNAALLAANSNAMVSAVRSAGGLQNVQSALYDNRPIVIQLNDREFGRAVRGYA